MLFVVSGQALANGKDSAPGQTNKATEEAEVDDVSQESSAEATEEAAEEDVSVIVFRTRTADDLDDSSGATQRSSSDDGSGRTDSTSSSSSSSSSPTASEDPVESAEDCPNEKNRYGEFTGNGANTSGAYDSTCDGRDAIEGPGNSSDAPGKPCDGCVGNADNKNPRGQFPDGSDANAGYECEADEPEHGHAGQFDDFKGNKGVGRGNPAHSTCQEESITRRPPVRRPPLPDVIKRPGLPPDRVKPRPPISVPPEVPRFQPRRKVRSVLPVTGPKQLLPYVWLAFLMIAAGLASLATARRRKELAAHQR